MLTVGLTGSSGSGKGYITEIMKHVGIPCLDTDEVCRNVYLKGNPCYDDLLEMFGDEILDNDGQIDRTALFRIAFPDKIKYEKLNSIAFYHIMKQTSIWIEKMRQENHRVIIIDAPMLYESGFDKLCDKVICVTADKPTQVRRIMDRDGISDQEARLRLSRQKSNDYYTSKADYELNNSVSNEHNIYSDTTTLIGVLRRAATRQNKLLNSNTNKGEDKNGRKGT